MIEFHYETEFRLEDKGLYSDWINRIIISEGGIAGQLDFIFCDDHYLLGINQKYLAHDTLTDVITFDYSDTTHVTGDIFISVERLKENAEKFNVQFSEELMRVMAHGALHLMGYNDKSEDDTALMRVKEDEKMEMFHVEQ